MAYTNNITITTGLLGCNPTVNITKTVNDLCNLYGNNNSSLVSSVFHSVSIVNFNCTAPFGKFFDQIIVFTQSIPIRIQVALVSIYFHYINENQYLENGFNGFIIDRESPIYFSSISLNNSIAYDACSSGDISQDPFCLKNSSQPECFNLVSNPWIFNCSTLSRSTTTKNNFLSNTSSSNLSSWQVGLICGLIILFLLISMIILGYFYRNRLRSKTFVLPINNMFEDMKSSQQKEIAHGQTFQQVRVIAQHKQNASTNFAWIYDDVDKNITTNKKARIYSKQPRPYHQTNFMDLTKIHDSSFPLSISKNSIKPICTQNDIYGPLSSKIFSTVMIPRSKSEISTNLLISKTESDEFISSTTPVPYRLDASDLKRFSVSEQLTNAFLSDESLHDEDAWIPILDIANAELALLNRLENERNLRKTAI